MGEMHRLIQSETAVSEISPVSHGNALSVYFRDPEGNALDLSQTKGWEVGGSVISTRNSSHSKPS